MYKIYYKGEKHERFRSFIFDDKLWDVGICTNTKEITQKPLSGLSPYEWFIAN